MKKWVHLFSHDVYLQSYGEYNIKNGSFLVFSADNNKKSVSLGKGFRCS